MISFQIISVVVVLGLQLLVQSIRYDPNCQSGPTCMPQCQAEYKSFIGDGYCDFDSTGYNIAECLYDGGDCCQLSCEQSDPKTLDYPCASNGYQCINPQYSSAAPTVIPPTSIPTSSGCVVPNVAFIGDGYCDGGKYNTQECAWDGGDCCASTCNPDARQACGTNGYNCHLDWKPSVSPTQSPISSCSAPNPGFIGDGYCDMDPLYNNALCAWDGGDCCEATCVSNPNPCGAVGFSCLNPNVTSYPTFSPSRQPAFPSQVPSSSRPSEVPSDVPLTRIPSSAPSIGTAPPSSRPSTRTPTVLPTCVPSTRRPSRQPTSAPSSPTFVPTKSPTLSCLSFCPAPPVSSAIFSDDGSFINILFSDDTDKGASKLSDSESYFPCTEILTFDNRFQRREETTCYWQTAATLLVNLESLAVPIDVIIYVKGNIIRPACKPEMTCDTLRYLPTSIIEKDPEVSTSPGSVYPPLNPTMPAVRIDMVSNPVLFCQNILLDLSGSTGNGVWNWFSVSWNVSGSGNTTEIAKALDAYGVSLDGFLTIDSSLIAPGQINIAVTLTNIWGQSHEGYAVAQVIDITEIHPDVAISGAALMRSPRHKEVTLYASVAFPQCGSNQLTVSGVSYAWDVKDGNGNLVSGIISLSQEPLTFMIPAFSFPVNEWFLVTFTTTMTSGAVSARSANLYIYSDGVVAQIAGGNRTVTSTQAFSIDATSSVNVDLPNAILTYSWSCIQSDGYSQCGFSFMDIATSNPGIVTAPADFFTISSAKTYLFKVIVSCDLDGSNSSAVVAITVNPAISPVVNFGTVNRKYNPQSDSTFTGILVNPTNDVTITWSSIPAVRSGANLSPLQITIPASPGNTIPFSISFAENSLISGKKYAFSIKASYVGVSNSISATASAAITMDLPPFGGRMTVTPLTGFALTTDFTMATSGWITQQDSLPVTFTWLTYPGGLSGDGSNDNILSVAAFNRFSAKLSPGAVASNYQVICVVVVTDIFGGASPRTTATIVVNPLSDPTAIGNAAGPLLSNAESSFNFGVMKQLMYAISDSLNAAGCDNSPVCDQIGREPCLQTLQTCGVCKSGYIGVDGDSNYPCVPISHSRHLADRFLTDCASGDSSCSAQCPNQCSGAGNGTCLAYDSYGNQIPTCLLTDLTCSVACSCNEGRYGSSCDMTKDAYESARATRSSMCSMYYKSLKSQDASQNSIATRLKLSATIMNDPTQITQDALNNCTLVVIDTVQDHFAIAQTMAQLVTAALSKALTLKADMSPDLLSGIYGAMDKLISSQTGTGSVITNNIRVSTVNGGSLNSEVSVTVPTTQFENLIGARASAVSFKNDPSVSASISSSANSATGTVGLSVLQYKVNPFGTSSNSSVVKIGAGCNSGNCPNVNFQANMVNPVPISYRSDNVSENFIRCRRSVDKTPYVIYANCSTGLFPLTCPGYITKEINFTCPHTFQAPECMSANSEGAMSADSNCTLVSFDEMSTVCACSLSVESVRPGTTPPGVSTKALGTTVTNILGNFVANVLSVQELSASSVTKNLIIFTFTLIMVLLLYIGTFYWSKQDIDHINTFHEELIDKADETSTIRGFFEKAIPREFDDYAWPVRFINVLKERHSVACFFFDLAEDEYRTTQWLVLIGKAINYCFVGTFIGVFFFLDDGTCSKQVSESTCLSYYAIDFSTNLCAWDSEYQFCSYVEQEQTVTTILINCLAINVGCIPLDMIVYYSCSNIRALLTYLSEERLRVIEEETVNSMRATDLEVGRKQQKKEFRTYSELNSVQKKIPNYMRAARLTKMIAQMDKVDVNAEVAILLQAEGEADRRIVSSVANNFNASLLLSDYVAPSQTDRRTSWKKKYIVTKKVLRQNLTGKNQFDGRKSIMRNSSSARNPLSKSKRDTFFSISQSGSDLNNSRIEIEDPTEEDSVDENNTMQRKLAKLGYQQLLRHNIKLAIGRTEKITRRISLLRRDERKEIYLLRKFLVEQMIGIRRQIATRFFFGTFNDEFAYAKINITFLRFWSILFPLYLTALCLYIFLYGLALGAGGNNKAGNWLVYLFASWLQDVFLLEVCSLYMVNIVLVSIVYKDLKLLSNRLRNKAKMIINRISGQMNLSKCYIQHINAGCRAARKFPKLPMARLLISLNDSDMPTAFVPRYHLDSEMSICMSALVFLKNSFVLMYLTLPESVQDAMTETVVTCFLNFIFLAFYISNSLSSTAQSVVGVAIFFMIGIIIAIPFTKAIRRSMWKKLMKLLNQSESQADYDEDAKSVDSYEEEHEEEIPVKNPGKNDLDSEFDWDIDADGFSSNGDDDENADN